MEVILRVPTPSEGLDASYHRDFEDLVRLCRSLGAGAESEDIAQETLVFARTHVHQLRDPSKVSGWLRAIAVRKTFRTRTDRLRTLPYEQVSAPTSPDLGLDLAAAISRLPPRERAVLTLVHGLGYSQDEAAVALGIRRGTVAATLFHARGKLADWLLDYQR
jgi:RNA polymerase sigma-70 factor, ECF subfamily